MYKTSTKQAKLFKRKKRKFSYATNNYDNPFFERTKKSKKKADFSFFSLKLKLTIAFIFFIFTSLVWVLLYSPLFAIKEIEARGGGKINPSDIEEIAWQQVNDSGFMLWPQRNLFFFKKKEFLDVLNLRYSFNEVLINKKLPNKILIQYNEKDHSMVWLEKDIYYYIDNEGYIVSRIGSVSEEKNYPIIKNISSKLIDENRINANHEILLSVLNLVEKFKVYQDMSIDFFEVIDSESTVHIKTKNGPYLYLDIYSDIDKQLNKIIKLKESILLEDFYNKEYIDVRIGDRVYHR